MLHEDDFLIDTPPLTIREKNLRMRPPENAKKKIRFLVFKYAITWCGGCACAELNCNLVRVGRSKHLCGLDLIRADSCFWIFFSCFHSFAWPISFKYAIVVIFGAGFDYEDSGQGLQFGSVWFLGIFLFRSWGFI